jgi:hypothetical protein
MRSSPVAILALTVAASAAAAQPQPAIRQLGPVVATSKESWGNIVSIRHLSGGSVLVNDNVGRKVVLLDSTLASVTVVADTTSATANAYAGRIGGLVAYRGDSTLFVDPASMSMLVVDPAGKVARVMSVPRSQDAGMLASFVGGSPGFDASGKLVYRGRPDFRIGPPGPNGGMPHMPTPPESVAIVRVDLATRQLDTVGMIKIPKVTMNVTQDDKGRVTMMSEINPLPLVDEWAVLSNGSVAFVRGREYRVDFVNPDGSRTSAPKIPFDWQRLSDEDKVALIDSVKAQRARMAAANPGTPGGPGQQIAMDGGGRSGGERVQVTMVAPGPGAGGPGPGPMVAGGPGGMPALAYVAPSELPDYKPPFFAGNVRADGDGNLWIRTIPTRAIPGGPVYDVINGKGELLERVQVPAGRQIVGFGPGGVVYLTSREGTTVTLERARAR